MKYNLELLDILQGVVNHGIDAEDGPDHFEDLTPVGAVVAIMYAFPDGKGSGMQYKTIGGINHYAVEGICRKIIRDIESD